MSNTEKVPQVALDRFVQVRRKEFRLGRKLKGVSYMEHERTTEENLMWAERAGHGEHAQEIVNNFNLAPTLERRLNGKAQELAGKDVAKRR